MPKFDKAPFVLLFVFVDIVQKPELIEQAKGLGYVKALSPGLSLFLVEDSTKGVEQALESARQKMDLVLVASVSMMRINKAVADDRTDGLLLNLGKLRFSRSTAALLKRNGIAAFLPFSVLLNRQELLRRYREALEILEAKSVPTAFPSWADEPLELRKPRELAALLASLGASDVFIKETMKETVPTLIAENELRGKSLAPGVRIK